MNQEEHDGILRQADNLLRLADNLDREAVNWLPIDNTRINFAEKSELVSKSNIERGEVLWANAVEAGIVIFELCGLGAFENLPRVKNLACQIRSEIIEDLGEFKVPFSHMVLNLPYSLRTGRTCDVYFVKLFEGFCKIWIKSPEDRRAFEKYYDVLKLRAQLHVKMMNELAEHLKSCFGSHAENFIQTRK